MNSKEFAKKVGVKLKREIHKKGMTQREFSRMVGISEAMLSCYINGNLVPSIYRFNEMAKVLGCSVDYLLDVSKI